MSDTKATTTKKRAGPRAAAAKPPVAKPPESQPSLAEPTLAAAPAAEAPQPAPDAAARPVLVPKAGAPLAPNASSITASRGFAGWLAAQRCGLAMTCYQTGWLCLLGVMPGERLSVCVENFTRAMGVTGNRDNLYVGGLTQLWRLANVLAPAERANEHFDRLYIPRAAQTLGDVDIHELGIDKTGRVIFVNTKFSCLATVSHAYGFAPIWKPPFISRLAAEDRCHLNGMAMEAGVPRYVTAVSRSDIVTGWRERRQEGGVLIDVVSDRILTDKLSMPHSPRVHGGQLYALDSGRGQLIRIDRQTGRSENIAFCPGFLRGLSFIGRFAVVTVSLPRKESGFGDLELDAELKRRDGEPWCGVLVIDLTHGDTVEWMRFEGQVGELFDVAVIENVACPMLIGPTSPDLQSLISYDNAWAPLDPTQAAA
ncbi:MAG TPA: TIGR03032 family protein [Caulobacteraceae bacterium]|nr:TIGR03032 family protein [Caulobacteraceae bacterium]